MELWFLSAIDHVFYSNECSKRLSSEGKFLSAIDHVFYSNFPEKGFTLMLTFLSAIDHVFYSNIDRRNRDWIPVSIRNRSRLLFQLDYSEETIVSSGFYPQSITSSIPTKKSARLWEPLKFLSAIDHVFYSNTTTPAGNNNPSFYPQSITSSIPTKKIIFFAGYFRFYPQSITSSIPTVNSNQEGNIWRFLSAIDHVFYSNRKN